MIINRNGTEYEYNHCGYKIGETIIATEESEYNVPDMAAYAACVNSLAVEYGVPTILWDCSVHVNRKELKVNYPA